MSFCLVNLVLDELANSILKIIPKCMFFADDIEESRDKVSSILELRRKTSESKGFYLSKSKIKYIHYNFSNKQEDDRDKNWRCHTTISKFNHLGSILQNGRKINKDSTHIIQVGWLKYQKTSEVIFTLKYSSKESSIL